MSGFEDSHNRHTQQRRQSKRNAIVLCYAVQDLLLRTAIRLRRRPPAIGPEDLFVKHDLFECSSFNPTRFLPQNRTRSSSGHHKWYLKAVVETQPHQRGKVEDMPELESQLVAIVEAKRFVHKAKHIHSTAQAEFDNLLAARHSEFMAPWSRYAQFRRQKRCSKTPMLASLIAIGSSSESSLRPTKR